MNTRTVVILGAGGTCLDIADTLEAINQQAGRRLYVCPGFLDDNPELRGQRWGEQQVLGPLATAREFDADTLFVNGIGSPRNYRERDQIVQRLGIAPTRFLSVIHPTAVVSGSARIGRGCVIFAHVMIAANVRIGRHVVILSNSVVNHDSTIGDFTCLASSVCISGLVRVGARCYLGANSSLRGGVAVDDGCLVGMGSVVIRDIPCDTVVAGNPARTLRTASTSLGRPDN